MPSNNLEPPLLDEINAAFIEGGIAMNASSRDSQNVPVMARASGCRVSPDRRSITLLVAQSRAADLLEAIRKTKQIAVVFTQPSTHRTIQLKGKDAFIGPAQKRDKKISERYADAWVGEVCPLGYAEDLMRALIFCDPGDMVAVTFSPYEAFQQTPGLHAGERLK